MFFPRHLLMNTVRGNTSKQTITLTQHGHFNNLMGGSSLLSHSMVLSLSVSCYLELLLYIWSHSSRFFALCRKTNSINISHNSRAFLYPGESFKGKQGSLEYFYTEQWPLVIKEHIIRYRILDRPVLKKQGLQFWE